MKKMMLAGLRVVDLSRVLVGPLCTQYLGDMGADVIKVEDIHEGDESRNWPTFRSSELGGRTSTVFQTVNRNKRDVAIDLKTAEGQDFVHKLAREADEVVESFAPGVAARLGVDALTLRALNPRLVHCSVTGFGTQGPLSHGKGYDLIVQAFCGMLSITGDTGNPPMRSPFSPVDQGTGSHALIGILVALNRRHESGKGCSVEAFLFDTSAAFLEYFLQNYWGNRVRTEQGRCGHNGLCPYGLFETGDKPIHCRRRQRCPVARILPDHRPRQWPRHEAIRHQRDADRASCRDKSAGCKSVKDKEPGPLVHRAGQGRHPVFTRAHPWGILSARTHDCLRNSASLRSAGLWGIPRRRPTPAV